MRFRNCLESAAAHAPGAPSFPRSGALSRLAGGGVEGALRAPLRGSCAAGLRPVLDPAARSHGMAAARERKQWAVVGWVAGSAVACWNTPSLVETRFSPDALVWVTVVFHGTVA